MAMLSERDRGIIKSRFEKELVGEVKLIFVTSLVPGELSPSCREEEQLLSELVELSPKLRLETRDFVSEHDRELIQALKVDHIPALIVTRDGNQGVRYYGPTSGYEFAAVIEDIVDMSKNRTSLAQNTIDALSKITDPVRIRVFVTPT